MRWMVIGRVRVRKSLRERFRIPKEGERAKVNDEGKEQEMRVRVGRSERVKRKSSG